MRSQLRCTAIVLVLTSLALAANETASELKARANGAHGGEQAKLCLEYARRQLEDANALFTDGQVDKAQAEVREAVDYARKWADAAASSGKQLKEIEDRPPLRQAVDEIEQTRSDLLVKMWGPQAEPKGKS